MKRGSYCGQMCGVEKSQRVLTQKQREGQIEGKNGALHQGEQVRIAAHRIEAGRATSGNGARSIREARYQRVVNANDTVVGWEKGGITSGA